MRLQVESPLHPCKGVKVFAFAVYRRRRLILASLGFGSAA